MTDDNTSDRFFISEEELQERVETLLPKEESTIPILKKSSTATTVLVVGMAGSGIFLLSFLLLKIINFLFYMNQDFLTLSFFLLVCVCLFYFA